MVKSPFSLAQVALVMSIVLTSLMPVSSLAAEQCRDVFANEPLYRRVNPSAADSGERYQMPNYRGLSEYVAALLPKGFDLRGILRRDSVVVDIGGGQGRAMAELAGALPVRAIVINTQDFSHLYRKIMFRGSFEFRAGWAEQKLKEFANKSVDVFFDLWGGFAYSPNKVEILEDVYRALKPGGRAFILFPSKTPAFVEHPDVNYGQPVSLDWFLAKRYPGVFATRTVDVKTLSGAKVIEITKPLEDAPETLDMGLQQIEVKRRRSENSGREIFSEVVYGVKP